MRRRTSAVMTAFAILPPCMSVIACAAKAPRIHGVEGAPPTQASVWNGPMPSIPVALPNAAVLQAADLQRLTMPQVLDMALSTNPLTRISWAQARVAAAQYGATRSDLFPTVTADVDVTRSHSLAGTGSGGNGGAGGDRTQLGAGVGLSYLVLDFGGRSGSIDAARELAIAADLSHNSVIQSTVLDVQNSIFTYLANRALRDAQLVALKQAEAAETSAEERRRVGLATIADVLQARTARSAVQLRLETLQGQVHVARGGVAVSMGLPANAAVDIPLPAATDTAALRDSVLMVTQSVDSIIAVAVRSRPDLAAAQAEALAAQADVRVARSAQLPAFTLGGNSAYTRNTPGLSGPTYNITFGLQLPVFNGFRSQYQLRATQDAAIVAGARTQLARQQVVLDVFTSYYELQTAAERVTTAGQLLASATENEEVALGRYREGVGTIVDLLVSQTALANARAEDVQAHWQWRSSLAQLAFAAGILGTDGKTVQSTGVR